MIKLKNGTIGLEQSPVLQALAKLFNAPFKDYDVIVQVVALQKEVSEKKVEFKSVMDKIVEAHGEKDDNGQDTIKTDNEEFIKLLEKDIELNVDKISITKQDLKDSKIGLSSNEHIMLESFMEIKDK